MSIDIVEFLPGMELGRGYDLLRSDPKILSAVKGKIGKLPMGKGQVSAEYNFSIVQSVDEFQKALGIDASVSVGLGVAGGSAKAKFEENCKVTSEATFCVVSFKALNAPMSLRGDIELEDEAMELLQLKDERRFRERYGTHFCSDLYTGLEFFGSIKIVSSSKEREVEIAASINARYGPAKASVKTSSSSSSASSDYSLEIFTFQSGGIMRPVSTLEELFETGKRVAKQGAKGLATPTQVVLGSYDELELPWDGESALAQQHAKKEMRRLKKLYDQMREDRNNIDYVLANPEKYVSFNVKKLTKAKNQITESLKQIVELSDQCAQDYSSYTAKEPEMPVIELPDRKSGERRSARIKSNNQMLRSRNKMLRAQILRDKADDLQPGQRKTRLEAEASKLVEKAKSLREKAKNAGKTEAAKKAPAKKTGKGRAHAKGGAAQRGRRRSVRPET